MPFNPQNPSSPGNPNDRKKTGTGFTNLNRIVQASQGNRLGQAVGGGVAQQAGAAKTTLNQAGAAFNQQSEANRLDSEQNKQKVAQGIEAANQGQADEQNIQDFSRFRQGQYTGPQQLQDQDKVLNQAAQAQNLGSLAQNAAGRQALLQRFVGSSGYSQGKQRLDNLLLGQSGQQDLRNARRDTQGLSQQATNAANAAQQRGQYLANQAQAFGQDVTNQLGQNTQQNLSQVDADLQAAQQAEATRQALYDAIKQNFTSAGVRDSAQNLTDAKQTDLNKLNQTLELARQNNILQQGDIGLIQKMYENLQNPAEKLYRQQNVTGAGGYLGYGTPEQATTQTASGGNIYSNLDINEVLNNAFKTQAAQNLDRAGVASDTQRARDAALAKLAGKMSNFGANDPRFQASSAAFDLNQAGKSVDAEIARLKNESIEDLPTQYQDVPFAEKLRRTFAPSGAEAATDINQDLGGALSGDASAAQRAAALARLGLLAPVRTMTGLAVNPAMQTLDSVNNNANKVLSGDVGQKLEGAAGLYNAPAQLAGNAIANVGELGQGLVNTVENNVPGGAIGKAALAPVLAPINFFGDTVTGGLKDVGNAIANPVGAVKNAGVSGVAKAALAPISLINPVQPVKKVAKAVSNIFCYAAGTPIRMKNGSYKAVDKLELGDELYYGGKVTATGHSKQENMYEYKGTKVSGSHAVFENGKFVRVEDSKSGKKLSGEMEVFPIECENHVMVTKTHLGADFSEIDGGIGMEPEERIKKLNSDKKKLKKLDAASTLLFDKHVYKKD